MSTDYIPPPVLAGLIEVTPAHVKPNLIDSVVTLVDSVHRDLNFTPHGQPLPDETDLLPLRQRLLEILDGRRAEMGQLVARAEQLILTQRHSLSAVIEELPQPIVGETLMNGLRAVEMNLQSLIATLRVGPHLTLGDLKAKCQAYSFLRSFLTKYFFEIGLEDSSIYRAVVKAAGVMPVVAGLLLGALLVRAIPSENPQIS